MYTEIIYIERTETNKIVLHHETLTWKLYRLKVNLIYNSN